MEATKRRGYPENLEIILADYLIPVESRKKEKMKKRLT